MLTLTCIFAFHFYFPMFYSLSLTSSLIPACIFIFHLSSFFYIYWFNPSTNPNTTHNFSLHNSTVYLALVKPILNSNPINITWLVLYLHLICFDCMSQHVLILSLSMSWPSLSLLSFASFSFYFVLQLETSTPSLTCYCASFHVSLACFCLCLHIYHASLSCSFIVQLVLHV